jgi:plasmid stability protein
VATLHIKNLPDGLYRKLRARARRNHRSVTQEVTHILTEATDEPATLSIRGLKGLGKEIWEGIDPAEYVAEERRSWGSQQRATKHS